MTSDTYKLGDYHPLRYGKGEGRPSHSLEVPLPSLYGFKRWNPQRLNLRCVVIKICVALVILRLSLNVYRFLKDLHHVLD